MSKVAIKGNPLGTGTFTIEAPNSDTNSTILLPVGGGSVVLTEATQTLTNKTISGASNTVSNLAASSVSSGTFDVARIPDLAASKITSGTIATARLASGTADSTTFLRGDSTWQTISTSPTTAQVLTATAGASVGAVGTYAFLGLNSNTTLNPGDTIAGSGLRYGSVNAGGSWNNTYNPVRFSVGSTTAPSGTWRLMGRTQSLDGDFNPIYGAALWLRIS